MMHTRCPHCQTVFRIRNRELEVAGGQVRCGACMRTFDARRHLQATLPLDDDERPQAELELMTAETGETATDADPVSPWQAKDVLVDDPPRRTRAGVLAWGGINVVLLAAFLAQLLIVQRDVFAQDPAIRPLLAGICQVANCVLPERRALDRIELSRRNVYSHPNVEDALIVEAEFTNRADFAQPYPMLMISFGDLRGQTRIRRVLAPEVYLDNGAAEGDMAPGTPVRVMLEIRDPGPEIRTFEFDFH